MDIQALETELQDEKYQGKTDARKGESESSK